jgi:hypothetical protein
MEGEISFRIQVALRSILVSEECEVRDFMEGKSDGNREQRRVDTILRTILQEKINACEGILEERGNDRIESEFIWKLWEAELHIAQVALEQLGDVQQVTM